MKSCLTNLRKCNADCCRYFVLKGNFKGILEGKSIGGGVFTWKEPFTDEEVKYYNLHEDVIISPCRTQMAIAKNKELIRIGDSLIIRSKCTALSKNNRCNLYNQEGRPKICSDGYTKTMEGVHKPKNCIY